MPHRQAAALRFSARFAVCAIPLGVASIADESSLEPLQRVFAIALERSLTALGWTHVVRQDVLVAFPGGTFAVGADCTAASTGVLLLAFVFAYPARWHDRAWGAGAGLSALALANVARLVTCAYVLRDRPAWFPWVHDFLWQVALVGVAAGLALAWTAHAGARGTGSDVEPAPAPRVRRTSSGAAAEPTTRRRAARR
jgi:exosortase/archaeosortase family protein